MINFIKQNSKIKDLYISKNVLVQIIDDFKETIMDNKELFLEMYKMDTKKTNNLTSVNTILNILDFYKDAEIENKNKEIITACYYGNPYITINLCMQALIKKRGTIAVIEDNMLAINMFLINIFNNVLKNYKIEKMIELFNNVKVQEIKDIEENIDYIVCIGNSNTYYKYCNLDLKNVKYIPFKNIALYSEDEEFKELKYELYKFTLQNEIEIEIFDDIDEFINCIAVSSAIAYVK